MNCYKTCHNWAQFFKIIIALAKKGLSKKKKKKEKGGL